MLRAGAAPRALTGGPAAGRAALPRDARNCAQRRVRSRPGRPSVRLPPSRAAARRTHPLACPAHSAACPAHSMACPAHSVACPAHSMACPAHSMACPARRRQVHEPPDLRRRRDHVRRGAQRRARLRRGRVAPPRPPSYCPPYASPYCALSLSLSPPPFLLPPLLPTRPPTDPTRPRVEICQLWTVSSLSPGTHAGGSAAALPRAPAPHAASLSPY